MRRTDGGTPHLVNDHNSSLSTPCSGELKKWKKKGHNSEKEMHSELCPLIGIALWIANTYSEFQENLMIKVCYKETNE